MKFAILALALLGFVAADVSHLSNEYLPPHMANLGAHKHVEYAQQAQEIPAPVEVNDNSVASEPEPQAPVSEKKFFTGKVRIDNLNYGPGYAGEVTSQSEQKIYHTGAIISPVRPEATTVSLEASVPAPGSDVYTSTQEQAAHWTAVSKQQDEVAAEPAESVPAPGSDVYTSTQEQAAHWTSVSQQQGEAAPTEEKKYYTGLVIPENLATVAETQPAEEKKYYTGLVIPEHLAAAAESQPAEEKKYYTGLVIPEHLAGAADSQPAEEKKYYTGLVYKPGQDDAAPALGASSGIDTQYAANGGYVY